MSISNGVRADWASRFGRGEARIVCVGLDYSDHTGESRMEPPKAPRSRSSPAT